MTTEPGQPEFLPPLSLPQAAALSEHLLNRQLVTEAELTAAGYRFLTVAHGDPEDDDQMARISHLSAAAWATGRTVSSSGGNDYLAIRISPPPCADDPAADAIIDELEHLAHQLDPGWWQIRRSAR